MPYYDRRPFIVQNLHLVQALNQTARAAPGVGRAIVITSIFVGASRIASTTGLFVLKKGPLAVDTLLNVDWSAGNGGVQTFESGLRLPQNTALLYDAYDACAYKIEGYDVSEPEYP